MDNKAISVSLVFDTENKSFTLLWKYKAFAKYNNLTALLLYAATK